MQKNQRVADMADEVLARRVKARVEQSAEPFEEALRTVLEIESGRQFGELRDGPHGDERASQWQMSMSREQARRATQRRPGRMREATRRAP